MKKFLVIALAAIMVFTLAACGESSSSSATTTATATKTLIMGTNATFPPYETTDDQGNIIGIDPEIAQAICDKLGYTLEIKDMEFDSLLSAVDAGSVDMVLAGLTVTEERAQSVNFSDSYASGKQVIIVKEGSEITSPDDLANVTIGVQAGTTGDLYCTDDFGADHVKQYTNGPLAIQALLNGQVDCVVIDNNPAKEYVAANSGLAILDTAYTEEDYAIAVAKSNTELQAQINTALAELKADGTIDAIIAKYINAN